MLKAVLAVAGVALLLSPVQTAPVAPPGSASHGTSTPDGDPVVAINKARIDQALAMMVSGGRVAGASALVWQRGKERYFGAAGFADREAKRPMTRDAIAQIYSMTKPVTGVALMTLWEQGKFRLDDPLAMYLPEFATMQVLSGRDASGKAIYRAATRQITVRDIMRHTAGFSYAMRTTAADSLFVAAAPLNLDNDLTEFGHRLATVPLLFEPGAEWSYSVGVDVQALLIEKLSGVPFTTYVRTHVLEPLGMTETAWTQPAQRMPRVAAMYQKGSGGALNRVPDVQARAMIDGTHRMTMGGAGIAAPIDDYMRFARMLLGGGALGNVRVLKTSTIRLMATDQLDPQITERFFLPGKGSVGFGFDFAVRKTQPRDSSENRGAVGEFFWDGAASTLFWVDPVNDLAAVFFVQVMPFDGSLHHDFRKAVYGADYLGPESQ